jgi:hypothetical protein
MYFNMFTKQQKAIQHWSPDSRQKNGGLKKNFAGSRAALRERRPYWTVPTGES